MEELFFYFLDTLNLILLPQEEDKSKMDEGVNYKLSELEGDYYTFLHAGNIKELSKNGYIPESIVSKIEHLRDLIDNLSPSLWNKEDFISNKDWNIIRIEALAIVKIFNDKS